MKTSFLEVPDGLAEALAKEPAARKAFDALSQSCRREHVHWISEAKRDTTRRKRIDETLKMLSQGMKAREKRVP